MSAKTVNMNWSASMPIQRALPVNWNFNRNATKIFRKPLSGYYGKFPLSMTLEVKGPPTIVSDYKRTVLSPQATKLVAECNVIGTPAFNIPTDIQREKTEGAIKGFESLPVKPVLSKRKQVPGRYFPKASLSKEQRKRAESAKEMKDRKSKRDQNPTLVHVDWNKVTNGKRSSSPDRAQISSGVSFRSSSRNYRTPCHYRIVKKKCSLNHQDAECFAIRFHNGSPVNVNYNPSSELHSDYYTIEKVPYKPRHVTFPRGEKVDFAGILSGMSKTLHDRYFIPNEHANLLITDKLTLDRYATVV